MDAVTYLKTRVRMCDSFNLCHDCEAYQIQKKDVKCDDWFESNPEQAVAIVEKWLAEHPTVTYLSKMREVFPNFKPTCECCLASALNKRDDEEIQCSEQKSPEVCWNREYGSLEGGKEK